MFIYSGKLKWQKYAQDETFVIILPNGPVRVGDTAYFFSQWTVDSKGVTKPNWFQSLVINKVSKTPSGDDTFTFAHHYYSWEITSQQVYDKLDVTMANPTNYKSTMTLDRIWQSEGDQSAGSARIWTGKINWVHFASNEMAIFIVPEGFGEGKPVLSLWQWTSDGSGKEKSPSFRNEVQKLEPGAGNGVKFSYKSYYDLTCTWDEKTEKLAVHMKGPEADQDLGEFTLSALIERHSHDFNPPEAAPNKAELEVRLPQAQPSLPRVLNPMPFPRTLVDTLAHTASFVDQAGYLAKYATERYHALDADFHVRGQQLDAAKSENGELNDKVKTLTNNLDVEKAKTADLEKKLADARDEAATKEAELNKKIEGLLDAADKDRTHDAEDHKALAGARQALEEERAAKADLQKRLDAALLAQADAEARLKAEIANVIRLNAQIVELQAKLEVEEKHNSKLQADNDEYKKKIADLEAQLKKVQRELRNAKDDLAAAEDSILDKDKTIADLRQQRTDLGKVRDAQDIELDNLKKKFGAEIKSLKEQLADATGN
ncbi:hypothetical protein B0T10DRAFT_553013 [Thelonectria olida]|uniref:Uncharacterized protein n=1 Tax=Thelonectria olida TaxID=1576542 RepID=A0A9P8VSU7_9HYPO|nr:hypothetical protein B0T10DRAFT_553013 [Thelonectria olida]